ncbi:3-isopropylmalate dehydratase small subunit [Pseudorhodobacter sp. MZDSW-24AT]|uniref:3-isopropylmalate dehydratase small subunit n=1 Tax=Pseudorhodobacter sp. MZDSW-24AT TaxID=2052957 RepID=UPI000C1ED6BD|nr:3-isopropylmalate dehydratase small subunit [Pseudorhodobacter sp. MZDSW-24AT]PJF08583.1 3-isopropylmalate dehydratase small subunit [Pseudorhodobacter sp. MZDSW-24AT]
MTGWTTHHGRAVALPLENIDTDQLIPARFMSAPREEGYGRFLLHDLRRDGDVLRPDFALNQAEAQDASILIARRNFGGGSSREAAVYALQDAGFRVVIAPSFGDIFAANAVNNGLLPARVTEDQADRLLAACPAQMTVDLATQTITSGPDSIAFALDPVWRQKLINGWDDIDLTASHAAAITAFASRRRAHAPWVWPKD